jgi:hypothetical protein
VKETFLYLVTIKGQVFQKLTHISVRTVPS